MSASTNYRFNEYSSFAAQWGGAWQGSTGLVLFGERFYDEGLGRFINRDPSGTNGGFNLYRYCGNNPTGRVDPSGLYEETDGGVATPTWPGIGGGDFGSGRRRRR